VEGAPSYSIISPAKASSPEEMMNRSAGSIADITLASQNNDKAVNEDGLIVAASYNTAALKAASRQCGH